MGGIINADIIVALILRNSMDQAGGGIDIIIEDIYNWILWFLSEQRIIQDRSNILMINLLIHQSGPNSIDDNDSIIIIICNLINYTILIWVI